MNLISKEQEVEQEEDGSERLDLLLEEEEKEIINNQEFQNDPYTEYNDDLQQQQDYFENYNDMGNAGKIKNFEKSFLIKFEEFQGENTSQPGSDSNRKVYERVSDRIYDNNNSDRSSQIIKSGRENNNDNIDKPYAEMPTGNQKKSKKKKKAKQVIPQQQQEQFQQINTSANNLFIIAEEDASQIYSEDFHSTQTKKFQEELQEDDFGFRIINREKSQQLSSSSSSQQKALSQNLNKKQTSDSTSGSQYLIMPAVSQKANSFQSKYDRMPQQRLNTQEYDSSENISQYIEKRIHTQKSNNDNAMLYSEEDLLSNIDRLSKILPMNEHLDQTHYQNSISVDFYQPRQKVQQQQQTNNELNEDILYYQQQIKRLQDQIENLNILLEMKKEELDSKIEQNFQLEDKIKELEEVILQVPETKVINQSMKRQDQGVQVNLKSFQQKSKEAFTQTDNKAKSKEGNGQMLFKKSPTRIGSGVGNIKANSISKEVQNEPLPPSSSTNQSRKQSLKQSPQSSTQLQSQQLHQNCPSFSQEDMKTFQQQQQTIMQLKSQLQRADNENLNLLERTNNVERQYHELEQQMIQTENEKKGLINKLDQFLLRLQENERDTEGLKAENHELKKNLESISQQNSPIKKLEKNLSAICLNNRVTIDTQTPPMGQLLLNDSYHFEYDKDQFSTFSSKDEDNKPMMIANQGNVGGSGSNQPHQVYSNELQQLLAKAKDYEQISLQLQYEIENHRKNLKQNQDKQIVKNLHHQKEEAKKKIKDREGKIEKLENLLMSKKKENEELQKKVEVLLDKNQNMKIKMEAKIQEKEFKILSLKQQLKHFATTSGFITPGSTGGPTHSNVSFSTKQDMLALINELIKQQIQQQMLTQDQSKHITSDFMNSKVYPYQASSKQRAKSYENTQNVSQKDENKSKDRLSGISVGGNVGVGIGFGYDNVLQKSNSQWKDNEYINQIISRSHQIDTEQRERGRETFYSKGSSNQRYHTPNEGQQNISFEIQKEASQPLKQIFNSSLKRINKELESIKELNSQGKQSSQGFSGGQITQKINEMQVVHHPEIIKRQSIEKLSFDDSLQDTIKNEKMFEDYVQKNKKILQIDGGVDQDDEDHSLFLQQFDERISSLNQQKHDLVSQGLFSRRLTEQTAKKTISDLREISWQQNQEDSSLAFNHFIQGEEIPNPLPTFQRPLSFKQPSILKGIGNGGNAGYQIEIENNVGKNVIQNYEQKEQNESIFYDLKPQFDYSNYSSSSNNDSQIKDSKHSKNNTTPNQRKVQENSQFFKQQQKITDLKRYHQSLASQQIQQKPQLMNNSSFNQLSKNFESKQNLTSLASGTYPNTSTKIKNHDYTPQAQTSNLSPYDFQTQMTNTQTLKNEDLSNQVSTRRKFKSHGGMILKESHLLKKPPPVQIQTLQKQSIIPASINSTNDNNNMNNNNAPSLFTQFQQYHSVTHKKSNQINNNKLSQLHNSKNTTLNFGRQQMGLNYASIKSSSCSNQSSQHLQELRNRYGRRDQ